MKKLFTLFALMLVCIGQSSAYDFEVDGIYYKISGDEATVTYNGNQVGDRLGYYTGNIVIPNTVIFDGKAYSVTSIGFSAFEGCSGLTSITIPNSVTSIGRYAFSGCSGLTSVTIPNSVTSIEGCAFEVCSGLTSVTIPNRVTSIGYSAFECCSGLTSVTIPNSVKSIGVGAFSNCTNLSSIVVESGNEKYDNRDNCYAIIETETNTLIAGCKNTLIPSSVTNIGDSAFEGCISLTSITIPNSVNSIGDSAFEGCISLTSITIPNSVNSIGEYAFEDCYGLASITIPNNVTNIGKEAFYGTYLVATSFKNNSSLNAAANDYWGITFCDSRTEDGFCITKNILVRYGGHEAEVSIPNGVGGIEESAFCYCPHLTYVCIPKSVIWIGEWVFESCDNLATVVIGENVENIGEDAFTGCENIKTIYSLAVYPPYLEKQYDCFEENVYESTKVYVPNKNSALARYLGSPLWSKFRYVEEMDMTGVEAPQMSTATTTSLINLNGQYITNAQRGINLQKMSNGTTKKVMMR